MTILFYSPFNNRSRDTESLMIAFKGQGHRVISLSQQEGKYIHPVLNSFGIETYTHITNRSAGLLFYLNQLLYFVWFCKKEKVNVVYSHLEPANSVASLGQYFVKARVFLCRHHVDEASLMGFNRSITYRLTYYFAKRIIVVSERARSFMIRMEGIRPERIIMIHLAYDFNLFPQPDGVEIEKICSKSFGIRLLTISRLTRYKRVHLSIQVLRHLHSQGVQASLFVLGQGEEMETLRNLVRDESVAHAVFFEGYKQNVQDYLSSADFLLHPSVLESSCVVVKEAAIYDLPVIVCNEVGDFDDYIIHEENGYKVDRESFVESAVEIIQRNRDNRSEVTLMAARLKQLVTERFAIQNIINQYNKLHSQ